MMSGEGGLKSSASGASSSSLASKGVPASAGSSRLSRFEGGAMSAVTSGGVSGSSGSGGIKGNPSQYVKLNVGGSLHYTTIGTLTKADNMLRAMFSGRMEVLTDTEGLPSLLVP